MDTQNPAGENYMPIQEPLKQTGGSTFLKTRDPHIDVMKGIGIILVLIDHMQSMAYLGYSILGYISMFAMPMFFFVNGYLYPSSSDRNMKFGGYALKKILTLFVPYVIFFFVSLLWTETIYAYAKDTPLFGFDFNWVEMLQALFLAGEYLYDLAVVPFPIWFLHALFFCSLAFFFIVKIKSKAALAIIAFALSIVTIPLQAALADSPLWLLKLFPAALCYMIFGYLFRGFVSTPEPSASEESEVKNKPLIGAFLSLLCMLAGFYCLRLGGGNMWEIASYWHFPGAAVSIIGCYMFSRCTNNKMLQFIGVTSLLYLGLHPLILRMPFVEGLPAWFEAQGLDGIVAYLGYFAVAFLLITILVLIARAITKRVRFRLPKAE